MELADELSAVEVVVFVVIPPWDDELLEVSPPSSEDEDELPLSNEVPTKLVLSELHAEFPDES
jgi:hypothetical protein